MWTVRPHQPISSVRNGGTRLFGKSLDTGARRAGPLIASPQTCCGLRSTSRRCDDAPWRQAAPSLMLERRAATAVAAGAVVAALWYLQSRRIRVHWQRVLRKRKHTFDQEDEAGDEQEGEAGADSGSGMERLQSHVGYNKRLVVERREAYDAIKHLARIPELDYVPSGSYVEATEEQVLWPMIEKSACILVPGAYFGDEGKGKTVDAIARHPKVEVVARVNSGENAGHTVFGENGVKYDFHLCPSGLLTPGKVNVVGPECMMDPVSFMQREVPQLIQP